ncbi:MAG: hypothetical protein GWO24_00860, partial [Akkermansiaceae bacterium]|nr:hypothetical protein [Akkermansiaceae bacterium]
MRNRILLLALPVILGAAVVEAQRPRTVIKEIYDPTRKKNKTELRVTPLLDQVPPSGYVPIRVFILNDASIRRAWEFDFTSTDSSYTDEGNQLRSSFSVECEAGKETEVELLVPVVTAFQVGNSTTELLIEVRAPAGLRSSSIDLPPTSYDERFPAVLVSEELYNRNGTDLSSEAETQLSGGAGGFGPHRYRGGVSAIEFGAAFNPAQMSGDWRAYSGFDVCLLTEDDWATLSSGARTALLRWGRLGGSLVVYTSNPDTDLATIHVDKSVPGRRAADLGWGTIRLENLPPGGILDTSDTVNL